MLSIDDADTARGEDLWSPLGEEEAPTEGPSSTLPRSAGRGMRGGGPGGGTFGFPPERPRPAGRQTISVDELVGRLYKAGNEYERKRLERQEAARRAEERTLKPPTISAKSHRLASGIEPLDIRTELLKQKREEKLEKVRMRLEAKELEEVSGKPVISALAQRQDRCLDTLTQWDERRNQKIAQMQHQRYMQMQRECTFQPQLCKGTQQLTDMRLEYLFPNDGASVYSRLQEDASRRQHEQRLATAAAEAAEASVASRPGAAKGGGVRDALGGLKSHNTSTSSRTSAAVGGGGTPRQKSGGAGAKLPGSDRPPAAAAAGSSPMSFQQFMQQLRTEGATGGGAAAPGNRSPAVPSGGGSARGSAPQLWSPRSQATGGAVRFDQFARTAGLAGGAQGSSRAEAPRSARAGRVGTPEDDELFYATEAPRTAPRPSPAAIAPSSARARSSSPGLQVVTYSSQFDDVLRAGYGGALPGTM